MALYITIILTRMKQIVYGSITHVTCSKSYGNSQLHRHGHERWPHESLCKRNFGSMEQKACFEKSIKHCTSQTQQQGCSVGQHQLLS